MRVGAAGIGNCRDHLDSARAFLCRLGGRRTLRVRPSSELLRMWLPPGQRAFSSMTPSASHGAILGDRIFVDRTPAARREWQASGSRGRCRGSWRRGRSGGSRRRSWRYLGWRCWGHGSRVRRSWSRRSGGRSCRRAAVPPAAASRRHCQNRPCILIRDRAVSARLYEAHWRACFPRHPVPAAQPRYCLALRARRLS